MEKGNKLIRVMTRILSYVLVATIASCATFYVCMVSGNASKLAELENLILTCFVGDADKTLMEDGAAAGMIAALGDQWSYYIPADEYDAYLEQMNNEYVGIGATVVLNEEADGFEITQLEPTGGAKAAGVLVGDVIVAVDGQKVLELGMSETQKRIRGESGTQVTLTVKREGKLMNFQVIRQTIQVAVAQSQMLEGQIGYIKIVNFDERCAEETLAAIESMVQQGAKALVFDVRNNPGGYKKELVKILDRLLPEGTLFKSVTYDGKETVNTSDAECLELPMAVLINGNSYSAAEFFAAALDEYDWALVAGESTSGKSYFQNTFRLSDGSAVGLSVGKYFTPNGVSLAEVGGLKPELPVEVDDTTAAKIYAGQLAPGEDPQIQAAIAALKDAG